MSETKTDSSSTSSAPPSAPRQIIAERRAVAPAHAESRMRVTELVLSDATRRALRVPSK